MNEICMWCGKDCSGHLVTAGRDEKGEPRYSCPWCWEIRHPPQLLHLPRDLMHPSTDTLVKAMIEVLTVDQLHAVVVKVNELELEYYALKLNSYKQLAIEEAATGSCDAENKEERNAR